MENSFFVTRRKALGIAAAGLASPLISRNSYAATSPVLVELFTSQGCSSCPPADRLAAELKNKPGVTVVSFNVDYWDYLGWKDTLAKYEYTKRQMDYAHARGDNKVYTPQMVFNGNDIAVGSSSREVTSAISGARAATVELKIQTIGTEVVVDLPQSQAEGEATLWLMAIAPSVAVKIERGENAGNAITYHNVVRNLVNAGTWKGEAARLKLPKSEFLTPDCKSCIAVLQKGYVGPMLGMAKLEGVDT
jgi:hypothetical protein